jgi:hypothetical protein
MISGIHMPNALITPEDLCAVRLGGFRTAKLMHYHSGGDVVNLITKGVRHFLVRLPLSTAPDGRWKGDEEWAGECIDIIRKFASFKIRDFQLDNEPNLTWDSKKAGIWRWLTERVIGLIRRSPDVPADTKLGLAPLAWKPDTWASVEQAWIPAQRQIVHIHDFLCVHSYWQQAGHFNLPPFGGNATEWHDKLMRGVDKPIVITEWANSSHEIKGITPEEVERLRLEQYPRWLTWISTLPYVEAAYLYILGGTEDWRGFWPTDRVLRAVGTATN